MVDEGWDGDLNGYADDGGADGWGYEDNRLDPYGRAEKVLAHAQASVFELRERLEKVCCMFLPLLLVKLHVIVFHEAGAGSPLRCFCG